MKVIKITFEINASQGEFEFRQYNTTEPVDGLMYVLVSKITKGNQVNFHLYSADANGPTLLTDTTVSMDKFEQAVMALEEDLQKKNPNVLLAENGNNFIAMGRDGIGAEKVHMGQVPPEVAAILRKLADATPADGLKMIQGIDLEAIARMAKAAGVEDAQERCRRAVL